MMRYLARLGTSDWMIWDRETRAPARYEKRTLVKLSRIEAVKLAAKMNGVATFGPKDGRSELSAAELLNTIKFRLSSSYPVQPRGSDLRIKVESDRWHAVFYSPDPVRDAAYIAQVHAIADDLVTQVKVKLN